MPSSRGLRGGWRGRIRSARRGEVESIDRIFRAVGEMSGSDFEQFVGELLKADGYPEVQWIGQRGDGGVDLRAGTAHWQQKFPLLLVQCKRQKAPVGPSVVRQLAGSLITEQRRHPMTEALLVSNAPLSRQAQEELDGFPAMTAVCGKRLRKWVRGEVSAAYLVRSQD